MGQPFKGVRRQYRDRGVKDLVPGIGQILSRQLPGMVEEAMIAEIERFIFKQR
jgi:hypothetical protein